MRCVAQRVASANVCVGEKEVSAIGPGLLALIGVETGDTEKDAEYIADKLAKLRVFEDENDKMNRSVRDIQGEVLMVSQFTLLGDTRGQNRPGFTRAMAPAEADRLYVYACERLAAQGIPVARGVFRAHMRVSLVNDGPVTMLIDSHKLF